MCPSASLGPRETFGRRDIYNHCNEAAVSAFGLVLEQAAEAKVLLQAEEAFGWQTAGGGVGECRGRQVVLCSAESARLDKQMFMPAYVA